MALLILPLLSAEEILRAQGILDLRNDCYIFRSKKKLPQYLWCSLENKKITCHVGYFVSTT